MIFTMDIILLADIYKEFHYLRKYKVARREKDKEVGSI